MRKKFIYKRLLIIKNISLLIQEQYTDIILNQKILYSSCFIKNYKLLKDVENAFNIIEIKNINKRYLRYGKTKNKYIKSYSEYFKEGDFSYIDECNDNPIFEFD